MTPANGIGAKTGRRRDWKPGREKVELEAECRVCGSPRCLEAAHIVSRAQGGDDHPDNVVPLCGPSGDSGSCHTKFDAGDLDLAHYLTTSEKCHAVALLDRFGEDGIEKARRRLSPSAYERMSQ